MIESARLLYAPFRRFVSGHVCFVFTLTTGEELVISPEADTKNFSILLGFFTYYTLRYRFEHFTEFQQRMVRKKRKAQEVVLALTPEQATALYRDMTVRARTLTATPEKYHILVNSCITNAYIHLRDTTGGKLGMRALLLPLLPLSLATVPAKR